MKDSYGREIDYLRISITDRCNFRCKYCMPEDGIEDKLSHNEILSFEDMIKIVKVFADLGIKKIRITGGEPLVRKGIVEFIGKINEIDKIEEITLTTNGYYLEELAYDLKLNGLDRVNISLDTLDENKFKIITRGGNLDKVIRGIKAAQKANLTPIKINAVLMDDLDNKEILDLINLTYDGIDVRFIELMPMGNLIDFAKEHFKSNNEIIENIKGLEEIENVDKSSPAVYFKYKNAKGKVGIINPITCKFCDNCNRVRLSSTGKLRTCLHSNKEIDLKEYINDYIKLKEVIKNAIQTKEESHNIDENKYISTDMNKIGG